MSKAEQGPSESEELNLTELFPATKENKRYGFDYGPLEELVLGSKIIIYRVAKNSIGIQFTTILGEKRSEIYTNGKNEFVKVGTIPSEERERIKEVIKGKGIRGKVDFLD